MPDSNHERSPLQDALATAFGDRYRLGNRLGEGAYGVVFRARDTMLDRDVAIKQVRLDRCGTTSHADEVKRRTEREARMAAKLRHPNIVAVHDIVHTDTSTLLIMEYVDGETLESKLKQVERLGLEETVELVAQTADALDYAHRQGVVHRDIKPANLMIDVQGRVKITDFGIAKSQSGSEVTANITATGNVLGTPYYMSPEQARGEDDLDVRSDLFSLACVTYECLSGAKPFRGKAVVDVLLQIVNEAPARLDCDALDLHADIEPVLVKALAKTMGDRFPTAAAFADALGAIPIIVPTATKGMPVVTSRAPGASTSFDSTLQGSLADRGLAEIIRDIQTGGKTGILHLRHDEESKRLYFLDGAMVFANSDVESDRLGQFLIGGGVIDSSSYERAAFTMRKTRRRLGRTLVALGNVEEDELDELINDQIQRIIYSVFGWESGRYRFETIDKPVEDDIARNLATDEIVLEGIRKEASSSTIRHFIGNTDRVLHAVADSPASTGNVTLTSVEGFVLSRVDGNTSVEEIVAISPLAEDETLRCIYGLITADILRLEEPRAKSTDRVKRVFQRELEAAGRRNAAEPASRPGDDGPRARSGGGDDDPDLVPMLPTSPDVIAEAKYRAAMGFYREKAYHEAVQNLRDAVRLAPSNVAYHKLLGQALTKDPESRQQAEGHLQRVLDAHPYDVDCYLELATIYEEAGLSTQARKMYEEVLRLDPSHEIALEKLGRNAPRTSPFPRPRQRKTDTASH